MASWRTRHWALGPLQSVGLLAAVLLAAGLHACTPQSPFPTAPAVVTVVVKPASDTLTVGQSVTLKASAKDAAGNTLRYRQITWTSSNATVAPVDENGKVATQAAGGATITAMCEGVTGVSTVMVVPVVIPPAVASVTMSPLSATINAGATIRLTATPKDSAGNALSGRTVTWSTSNTAVATVDGTGLVTGRSVGAATITATCEGKSGIAAITVIPSGAPAAVASVTVSPSSPSTDVGGSVQLTATPKDAAGNPLTDRTVTWSSGNTAVATVDAVGLVAGASVGVTTITASCEGKTGTATVTVAQATVASVTVSPGAPTITAGATVQLTAIPKDASGNPLTGRSVTWSSGNTAVATVNAGLVTGVSVGVATITASCEGKSGTATVTVTNVSVASVTVSPGSPTISAGGTVQLTASPKDASGNALTGRPVTWSTSSTAVATVNVSGLVLGVSAGVATITATCEGKTATATVTVTAPQAVPVASVVVSPPSASVAVGASIQFTATPKDASGTALTGRTVTWSSGSAAVATVSAGGLVAGQTAGQATITATCEGVNGTATVTVEPEPPPPPSSEVFVGAGDIADCGPGADLTADLLDHIPGTVFTAGDNAYPDGSAADYAYCYDPTWGRHKARTWPAPGNKDYTTPGAPGYFDYFGARAGPPGLGYYSFDLGDWHILMLNSIVDMAAGSVQEQWVRADLAANTKDCVLAVWHHARFSAGPANTRARSTAVFQALYEAGAEVVIVGHDHNYQRFAPQSPAGQLDVDYGIREFVVGTGGAHADPIIAPAPNTEAYDGSALGVLKLTLGPGTYSWEFVPVAGATFTDSGSGTCHGPPAGARSVSRNLRATRSTVSGTH
jgi:uncharacterized protein YjdB